MGFRPGGSHRPAPPGDANDVVLDPLILGKDNVQEALEELDDIKANLSELPGEWTVFVPEPFGVWLNSTLRYRLVTAKSVQFAGSAETPVFIGAEQIVAFGTFPEGFRPAAVKRLVIIINNEPESQVGGLAQLRISPSGAVELLTYSQMTSMSIDILFPLD